MRPSNEKHPSTEVISFENLDEKFLDQDFLVDLDKAFETIQIQTNKVPKIKRKKLKRDKEAELVHMQATFLAISQVHLRPVLRYLKAIQQGVASKSLCEIVHYVIGPMILKTKKVQLIEQTEALIAFQRELKKAIATSANRLTSDQCSTLSLRFQQVEKTFLLDFRGHSPAVYNLLGYYKSLKKNPAIVELEIRKLFAIGIPSLSMIRKSSLHELQSLSGISVEKISALRLNARNFKINSRS